MVTTGCVATTGDWVPGSRLVMSLKELRSWTCRDLPGLRAFFNDFAAWLRMAESVCGLNGVHD